MKNFIVGLIVGGLIVGAAAFAVGGKLMRSQQNTSPARNPPLASAGRFTIRGGSPPSPAPAIRTPASTPATTRVSAPAPSQASDTAEREPAQLLLEDTNFDAILSDPEATARKDEECFSWHSRKQARERAIEEAEPKDAQWSYPTEQLLRQFVSSHEQRSQFEITSIDCRTTYCEIKAVGREGATSESFQQFMEQARQQPWGEFGPGFAFSGQTTEGKSSFEFTLKRR